MDMFSEDGTTDQILIRSDLLQRFVTQEKVYADLYQQFRRRRRRNNRQRAKGGITQTGKGEQSEIIDQNQASDASNELPVMNRQEMAVVQTVAYNFKRFIRYKEQMLKTVNQPGCSKKQSKNKKHQLVR
jgi:hypothetical protein